MIYIQDNEVKNIAECNLLHDIINPHKCAKMLNSNYSPIIHLCINFRIVKSKFKSLKTLLGDG